MISILRLSAAAAVATTFLMAGQASAVPALQLDILNGNAVYDPVTETVVTTSKTFTLRTLATPIGDLSQTEILNETFYISIALIPRVSQGGPFNAGSFVVDGNTIQADTTLTFGNPPVDAATGTELPSHDIFPTYYKEIAFAYSSLATVGAYNTQDGSTASGTSYYVDFDIDRTLLSNDYTLHFDLYDNEVKNGATGTEAIDHFAPFSHDAEGRGTNGGDISIPAPASLTLLLGGLFGAGYLRRRRAV